MVSGVMWLVVVVVVLVVVVLVLVVMVVVSVLLLFFSAPTVSSLAHPLDWRKDRIHSHIRWISEGTAFTCRYIAQAATPLHSVTLKGSGSA